MLKKIVSISFMLIVIILMTTPFGIAMTFAPSSTERVTKYFSYFSMMPLGYGNWFPAITVLLSIVVFFLLLVDNRKGNTRKVVQVCLIICIISSMLSWLLFNSITIVGAWVAGIHIIIFLLQIQQKTSPNLQKIVE